MALVNKQKSEINAKIVYFGPGLSGKTTNLKHIYGKLKPEFRGALKTMKVQGESMVFFDLTPPGEGMVHGYQVRFHLYTFAGTMTDMAPWKMVLKGVDGIVFVADSSPERIDANITCLSALEQFLKGYGADLTSIPMVVQFTKRDLKEALSKEEMQYRLGLADSVPIVANTIHGEGVLPTFISLIRTLYGKLRDAGVNLGSSIEELQSATAPVAEFAGAADQSMPPEEEILPAEELTEAESAVPESLPVVALAGKPTTDDAGVVRIPLRIEPGGSRAINVNIAVSLEISHG